MKYSICFLGIKKSIEHDLQFGDRILAFSDFRQTFNKPFFMDSSARQNGLRHLENIDQRYDLLVENNEEFTKVKVRWNGTVMMLELKTNLVIAH